MKKSVSASEKNGNLHHIVLLLSIHQYITLQFICLLFTVPSEHWYWQQRADERHGNLPRGNQELLVVNDKVGRSPGELGVSKSMECDIFPFSALTLLVGLGNRKGIRPVKNTGRWFVGGDDLTGALYDL